MGFGTGSTAWETMSDPATANIVISDGAGLIPLLAGVAAFFYWTWKDPKRLLWAFIAAQPLIGGFYYTNIEFFSAATKLPIFVNNLFILAFVLFLARKLFLEKERIVLPGGAFLWYPVFLAAAGASVFTTDHFSVALNAFGKLAFWYLILLSIVNLALSREEIKNAFFLTAAVSLIPLAVGVSQLAHFGRLEVPNRLNSLYVHPNVFAYYLVLLIAVGWFLLPFFEGWKKRIVPASLGLSLFCLVFTFTRGAMICLVLSFGLVFLLFGVKPSHLRTMGLVLAGAALLVLVAPPVREKVAAFIQYPHVAHSLQWRWTLWTETVGELASSLRNLYSGRGVGTFHFYAHFPGFAAHNDYLMIWSGAGLAAVAALVVFYVKMLLSAVNHVLAARGEDRAVGKILFVAVLTAAVGLSTENLLLLPLFQTHFWLICGLAVRSFRLGKEAA